MTENTDAAQAQPVVPDAVPRATGSTQFLRHFLEMVVAMVAGMMVLGMLWRMVAGMLLPADVVDRADVAALVMATNMTLGMAAWMVYRRHGRGAIVEMAAAMYLPFLVLLIPYWAGAVSGGVMMMGGHVLMLPAMLLAMLRRRAEYTRPHGRTDAVGG